MQGSSGDNMQIETICESGLIGQGHYGALKNALEKGMQDSSFITSLSGSGPVEEFEEAFVRESGGKYALALSSCTAALHTALMALDVGPGDEVVVTPYSWGQSVSPVLFAGATAVFADIDPTTLTLDPQSVESRICDKTRAIIAVHLFGNPADMDSLCAVAKRHKVAFISDAAQAFGALSKGRSMGELGDATCFSLGRGKGVFGGEGGVLVTDDRALYEQAVAISQHPLRAFRELVDGSDSPFLDELSWNYRIHPLAAVLALADLEVAGARIAHRKHVLDLVHDKIHSIPGIEPIRCYQGDSSAAYGVPLTYNSHQANGISRQSLVESLYQEGMMMSPGPVRTPIYMRQTFQRPDKGWLRIVAHPSHGEGSCPVAESRCESEELQFLEASMLDKITLIDATEMIEKMYRMVSTASLDGVHTSIRDSQGTSGIQR